MERIASFSIDHTRLEPGLYLSREDGDVRTWDVRMKKPNQGDYVSQGAIHTIEHLFATCARSGAYKDGIVYVGPMGCRTGMYLLTRGLTDGQVLDCVRECYAFMSGYEGEIPGAKEAECGNYREHDLDGCRCEARAYLKILEGVGVRDMRYTYYLE